MKKIAFRILITAAAVTGMSGCTQHYKVTEVGSGKSYYTTDKDAGRDDESGHARFKDAKTGNEVTLQSTEVQKISAEEFDKAVSAKK